MLSRLLPLIPWSISLSTAPLMIIMFIPSERYFSIFGFAIWAFLWIAQIGGMFLLTLKDFLPWKFELLPTVSLEGSDRSQSEHVPSEKSEVDSIPLSSRLHDLHPSFSSPSPKVLGNHPLRRIPILSTSSSVKNTGNFSKSFSRRLSASSFKSAGSATSRDSVYDVSWHDLERQESDGLVPLLSGSSADSVVYYSPYLLSEIPSPFRPLYRIWLLIASSSYLLSFLLALPELRRRFPFFSSGGLYAFEVFALVSWSIGLIASIGGIALISQKSKIPDFSIPSAVLLFLGSMAMQLSWFPPGLPFFIFNSSCILGSVLFAEGISEFLD